MADTKKAIGKVSLTPKGSYDPAATYERLDVIRYDCRGYIVLADSIQGVTPEDGDNYMLLVDNGADGLGLTTAEKTAMLTLFKAAAYTSDVSATIADLETLWDSGSGDSGGDSGGGLSASYSNGNLTLNGVTAVHNSAALHLSGVSAAYNNGVLKLT